MPETERPIRLLFADYPLLFGGELPPGCHEAYASNRAFVENLIPPAAGEEYTDFDRLVMATCATVLTEADRHFGRNTGELGANWRQQPDGIWGEHTMPTFYHNGDGTRLAMLGTTSYMDFTNKAKRDDSPYADRGTYLKTLLTAVYDDIVFGTYGRGGDEQASADLARAHLLMQGFAPDVVEDVVVGIEASIFNELTGRQQIDPEKGALPVQVGSVVGDLWALGTAQAPANTFLLALENLWKKDTAIFHHQKLRSAATNEFGVHGTLPGESLYDFFDIAQRDPRDDDLNARIEFGALLIDNRTFLLHRHRYPDLAVNELMRAGKEQSAQLQAILGQAIIDQQMSIGQAFHCALSYADARAWRNGEKESAALPPITSPQDITRHLLRRRSIEEIAAPVDALEFFRQYVQDAGLVPGE